MTPPSHERGQVDLEPLLQPVLLKLCLLAKGAKGPFLSGVRARREDENGENDRDDRGS
jgi:hypothetical protein